MDASKSTMLARTLKRVGVVGGVTARAEDSGGGDQDGQPQGSCVRAASLSFVADIWQRARDVFRPLRAGGHEYARDYAGYFASAMIYYALVSLVPLLLLLMTGIGWLLRIFPEAAASQQDLLVNIQRTFGGDVSSAVNRLFLLLEQKSLVPMGVSLVGLLVTASVLAHQLQVSSRAIWKKPSLLVSRSPRDVIMRVLREKARACVVIPGLGSALLAAFALIGSVNWLMRHFGGECVLVVPSSLLIVPLTFVLLLRFLCPVRLPWRHVWVAALLCGGACRCTRRSFEGGEIWCRLA
jgi:membrane protein